MDEPQEPIVAPESAPTEVSAEVPLNTSQNEVSGEPPPAVLAAEPVPEVSPTEAPVVETAAPASDGVVEAAVVETAPEINTENVPPPEPPAEPEPAPSSQPSSVIQTHSAKDDSTKGNAAKKQKVEKHLEKILAEARTKGKIANRDVVKLLRISDATASRYLRLLVSRGQLQKTGKGRSVLYTI